MSNGTWASNLSGMVHKTILDSGRKVILGPFRLYVTDDGTGWVEEKAGFRYTDCDGVNWEYYCSGNGISSMIRHVKNAQPSTLPKL